MNCLRRDKVFPYFRIYMEARRLAYDTGREQASYIFRTLFNIYRPITLELEEPHIESNP